MIAELKQLVQQPPEEERSQTPERTQEPQAEPTEQPAGAGPLLGQALQEHVAQAMRPVLMVVQQRIAHAPQSVEQGRPAG